MPNIITFPDFAFKEVFLFTDLEGFYLGGYWSGGFHFTDLEGFLLGGYLPGGFHATALEGLIWRVFTWRVFYLQLWRVLSR